MSWIAALLLAALPGQAAQAAVQEARLLVDSYHLGTDRLSRARGLLEESIRSEPDPAALTLLCRTYFLLGDVVDKSGRDKLDDYARGREAGRRAMKAAPGDPEAHFCYAAASGRWGQTRGVMRSLFLLPTLRKEIDTVLKLDPRHARAHVLAGNVDLEVPRLMGGGLAGAERHFRTALELEPRYTAARIGLAQVLIRRKDGPGARAELEKVLGETRPLYLADWTLKDVPKARELEEGLAGRRP